MSIFNFNNDKKESRSKPYSFFEDDNTSISRYEIAMKRIENIPIDLIKPKGKNQPWKNRKCINLHQDIIPTTPKVTNKLDLPELFYRRACINTYSDSTGAYVTGSGLAKSKKQFALGKLYSKATITDADNMMDSIMGTAIHNDMEIIGLSHEIIEVRRSIMINGYLVSAQLDHYDGISILSDYKITKAFQKHYRRIKKEKGLQSRDAYILQANFNAYLLRRDGYAVHHAYLVFWYKDYDKYTYKKDYPLKRQETEQVELWSDEKCERVFTEIIKELTSFELEDCQQFECDYIDQWRDPPEYSLQRIGSKRSLNNTTTGKISEVISFLRERYERTKDLPVDNEWYSMTREERMIYAEDHYGEVYINRKFGEPTFCENYCQGRLYCAQYQEGYRHATLHKLRVTKDDKTKVIEMYGITKEEALENTKLIHPGCDVFYENGGNDV